MKKREKSAFLTAIVNLYYFIIASFLPFVVRTLLIQYIGIEFVGIKGLFESILQLFNIVNLGADASFFSYFLFKPCEDKNYNFINAIMGFIKKIYLALSGITLFIGLIAIPFLPYLVNNNKYPNGLNIYYIFIIYVIHNSMGYIIGLLSMAYRPLLLEHIASFTYGTSFVIMYIIQILLIIYTKNFALYTTALLVSDLFMIIFFYSYNRNRLSWLTYKGKLPEGFMADFKKRIIPMFVSKIRNISRNSIDSIIISHFMGLAILAQYQNYYQIVMIPLMLIGILNSAIQPALGNGISVETPESNYGVLKQFTFIQNFAVTVCTTCLITLIQPFIKLWLGTQFLLGMDVVVCVGIYFYVLSIADIGIILRNTTGTWENGMWVAVVESLLNLILNIILIRVLGLWGIILASVVTVAFINIPFELKYVFKHYFLKNYHNFIYMIIWNTLITTIITLLSFFICMHFEITSYRMAFIRCLMAVIMPTLLFIIFHHNDEEYDKMKSLIIQIVQNSINKIQR